MLYKIGPIWLASHVVMDVVMKDTFGHCDVIQGIIFPHYIHSGNLNNYGFSHVLKIVAF
jgi:hypothetical protein